MHASPLWADSKSALRVSCRPASSECTEPLWTTIRSPWRQRTSAARQTLSLHRYLRYAIALCAARLRDAFDVVQLPGSSGDRAVFGSPPPGKSHAALCSHTGFLNCPVGSCSESVRQIFLLLTIPFGLFFLPEPQGQKYKGLQRPI